MKSRKLKKEIIDGNVYLSGVMFFSDTPNANGIIYPRPVLELIAQTYTTNHDKILGMAHSNENSIFPPSGKVPFDKAVATLESLEFIEESNEAYLNARVKILDTHGGKFFKQIFEQAPHLAFGLNSIGSGTLDEDSVVSDGYKLIGFTIAPLSTFA